MMEPRPLGENFWCNSSLFMYRKGKEVCHKHSPRDGGEVITRFTCLTISFKASEGVKDSGPL